MKKILIAGMALSFCTTVFASTESTELAKWENQAKKDLELILVDPDSAKFKMLAENCGYINSKNAMGGYTGFKKFRIWKHDNQVLFFSEQDKKFSLSAWEGDCNQPKTL